MAYNFKSIADVEVVAEPTESANVLIEENGVIKKASKTAVGGAGGGHWAMLTDNGVVASDGIYEDLENFFVNYGTPVSISTYRAFTDEESGRVYSFSTSSDTSISWNYNNDEFQIGGSDGIIFYIRKDGNHTYYWD